MICPILFGLVLLFLRLKAGAGFIDLLPAVAITVAALVLLFFVWRARRRRKIPASTYNLTRLFVLFQLAALYLDFTMKMHGTLSSYLSCVLLLLVLMMVRFLVSRLGDPKNKSFFFFAEMLSIILIPALLFAVRFFPATNGQYINIRVGGHRVLVCAIVFILLPFALSRLFGHWDLQGKPGAGWIFRLLWCGLVLGLLVLNKDLGMVLCTGAAMLFTCLPSLHRNGIRLLLFAVIAAAGVVLYLNSTTLQSRISVCFGQANGENALLELTNLNRLFLAAGRDGFWGSGAGSANWHYAVSSDYIVYNIIYSFGIAGGLVPLATLTALFLVTLKGSLAHALTVQEDITQRTIFVCFAFPMIYIILANLAVVPLTGISFPWLAAGLSCRLAYTVLLGIVLGIQDRAYRP